MHHKIFTIFFKKQIFFLYTDKIGNVEAYLVGVNRWLKIFAGSVRSSGFCLPCLAKQRSEKSTCWARAEAGPHGPLRQAAGPG